MAELPINNTGRYFIDYQNAVASHTMIIRCSDTLSFGQIDAAVQPWLSAVGTFVGASTITSCRYSNKGETFSNPQASSLVGVTFGSGTVTVEQNATAMTFVGRDQLGHRARISVFGFKQGFSNYRLTTAESAAIGTAVAALNNPTGVFLAISDTEAVWYQFADIKPNDYWVRRARS